MKSLLIRTEDKNKWERRTPLIPLDLKEIIDNNHIPAFVQKSEKRIFPDQEYQQMGAQLCDDMSPGDIIVGIKEIPSHKILIIKYIFSFHIQLKVNHKICRC